MLDAGLTLTAMARDLGIPEDKVRRSLRRYRLPMVSERWLRQRYVHDGATMEAIAAEMGCSFTTIFKAIHRAHIPTRPPGGPPRHPNLET